MDLHLRRRAILQGRMRRRMIHERRRYHLLRGLDLLLLRGRVGRVTRQRRAIRRGR